MTDSKRSSVTAIVVFALLYLILDSLVAMLFLLGRFSVFGSIFYIYWSNFVVFPAFGLIYFFFTVIRKKNNWASLVICSISIMLFAGIEPKYGVFNVMGNVDHELAIQGLDRMAGTKTLINRNTALIQ